VAVAAGSTLRVAVTAQNKNGATTAISAATAPIPSTTTQAPPPPGSTPAPSDSDPALAPAPTPTPTPAPAPQNGRFGFATPGNLMSLSSSDVARYLDGAQAAHAGWVRFGIHWDMVQAGGPGSYNWTFFDNFVNATRARGMKVLAVILFTPSWARPGGTSFTTPPTNLADYATFAKATATHYSPLGVHAYEIWNEPNIAGFWAPGADPARYTQMLKLAYPAIKSADPSATVVSGGLSPYGSYGQRDSQNVNPLTFLEAMYANGAAGSFDALGWHPYNFPYGLSFTTWSAWSQMAETTPSARSIMTAGGDGAKQIWATEFGAPTGNTSRDVNESVQAQLVTDSYARLKSWSWAGPAFFYSYRDNGTNRLDVEDNFGVLHFDWTPKPSYTAFQSAAAAG
jgi:polysaccharide biosynthesis protein PslG